MIRSMLVAILSIGLAVSPAFAQDAEFTAVQSVSRIVPVENADGSITQTYVEADRVVPGEDLHYELVYNNGSSDVVDGVKLVMLVPAEMIYEENSARSEDIAAELMFSVDGGESFATRNELIVDKDGARRPAQSSDITHIRWSFSEPVVPGARGKVAFEAIVR